MTLLTVGDRTYSVTFLDVSHVRTSDHPLGGVSLAYILRGARRADVVYAGVRR